MARLPYHWEMQWQRRRYLARQQRELMAQVHRDALAERAERLAKDAAELDTEDASPALRPWWPSWNEVAQAVGLAAAMVATILMLILGWMRVLQ